MAQAPKADPSENEPESAELVISDPDGTEQDFEEIMLVPEPDDLTFTIKQSREDTRGRLAQFYVIGFFIILILVALVSIIATPAEGQSSVDNLRESVLAVSGILSGPLGFIIGFYFRKLEEE